MQFVFCTQLFTEKHFHFTTPDDVMTLILFKFVYCSFYEKKKEEKKKQMHTVNVLKIYCFCFYKMLINTVAAQEQKMCCGSSSWASIYEPPHDKTNKMTVGPAKIQISLSIRPVWSESSLCVQWVATLRTQAFFMRTAKTLIRLGGCPGWSESSLGAHSFFCFVRSRLKWWNIRIYSFSI